MLKDYEKHKTKDNNSMLEPIAHEFMHAQMHTLLDKCMPSIFPNLEADEFPLLDV